MFVSRQSVGIQLAKNCTYVCVMYEVKFLCMYKVTVGVHKCNSPLSHHYHPGQSVHRQNTPSKESQWSQQWPYNNNKVSIYKPSNQKTVTTVMTL